MEQLMAHAMASHNQQHQFHPGQIDMNMKHFGAHFVQPHGFNIHQQALMGNPNMGAAHQQPHHSVSLQIPDPQKMVKPDQVCKMPQQQQQHNNQPQNYSTNDCHYPLMSIPASSLAQNLSINKKDKHSSISGGSSSSYNNGNREDPWLNSNVNNANNNASANSSSTTATNGKGKKGKGSRRASEPGGSTKQTKSQKRRFSANSNPSPISVPDKEKPFECVTCGRRFTQRIGMLQHQRRHTGERPFACNFCEKRFTQKSGLVQHERLHTNEKPFGCSFCEKAFTQKSGLVQHERTHTGEKPYVCPICAKAFTQLSGLKQHKKVHERSSDSSK